MLVQGRTQTTFRILKILLMELGFVYMHEHNALSGEKNKGAPVIKRRKKNLWVHARKKQRQISHLCVSHSTWCPVRPAWRTGDTDKEPCKKKTKNQYLHTGGERGCWWLPLPGAKMSIHSHPSLLHTDILSRTTGSAVSLPFRSLSEAQRSDVTLVELRHNANAWLVTGNDCDGFKWDGLKSFVWPSIWPWSTPLLV